MTRKDSKEQMNDKDGDALDQSGETHSGMPNPADPNAVRATGHKSGYGGEGGEPRTSSDTRPPKGTKPA